MSSICSVCGAKITFHATKIKDGQLCAACRVALPLKVYNDREKYTAKQIYQIIHMHDGEEPKPLFCFGEGREYEKVDSVGRSMPGQSAPQHQQPQPKEKDKYDEIRECKKLLDEGIITEEEFLAKKKELLGL